MIKTLAMWVLTLTLSVSACGDLPKYKRSDCIVRINIEWRNDINEEAKEHTIRSITDVIRTAPDLGFNRSPPSSAIQGNERQFIYYQFKDDCENRLENARLLLSHVRRMLENPPPLEVDSRSFLPGLDTIRSSGPWWIDQEEPMGRKVEIDGEEKLIVE